MNKTKLSLYVNKHGQTETARRVGVTQGAISQMLASDRDITVITSRGVTYLEERKVLTREK